MLGIRTKIFLQIIFPYGFSTEKFLRCFAPAQRLNLAARIAKRLPRRKINSYCSYLEKQMEKYRFSVSRLLLNSKTLTTCRRIKTLAFYAVYNTRNTNRLECARNVIEQLRLTLNRMGILVCSKKPHKQEKSQELKSVEYVLTIKSSSLFGSFCILVPGQYICYQLYSGSWN